MQFRILGPLQVLESGRPIDPGGPKQRALLAVLLIHANEVASTDQIMEQLWPSGPPAGGAKTLHVHVSKARKALAGGHTSGNGPIHTHDAGYRLEVDPDDVDALLFERLWRRARSDLATNPSRASAGLRRALGLWRGPALQDFTYEPFAEAEIRRLNLLWLSATEDAIDADLALGRHGEILDRLESLTRDHPLQERLRGQLMITLYRLGRQADALRAYSDLRQFLGEELGIDPSPALQDLEERILLHDTSLLPPPARHPESGELPARLTSLVGRWKEKASLEVALRDHRLVTVNGVAGVGKTSLAIEVARDGAADHPDGIWLIPLSDLDDGHLVAPEVARALGVANQGQQDLTARLVTFLKDRRALLVLDNCEHVAAAAARLAETLLRHCAEVRIMATSRVPLGVDGEATFLLEPLDVPGADAPYPDLETSPSIRLLVERVEPRDPGFSLNPENAAALGDICRAVAGIPLAIELAAARLPAISESDLARRMDDQLTLLSGGKRTAEPRQQTLEAALDWSYQLLSADEQAVLNRIGVFRSAFSLDAADAVAGGGAGVAGVLGHLVEASLLTTTRDRDERRYRMLEPVRRFSLRRLSQANEDDPTRAAHARYFAASAAAMSDHYESERWTNLLRAGESIIDDCREALAWAVEAGDGALALGLAASLGSYWTVAGATQEGSAALSRALAAAPPQPTHERLRALEFCAEFAVGMGEPADRWLDELDAWALDPAAGDMVARVAGARGLVAYARGDLDTALGLFEAASRHSLDSDGDPVRTGTLLAECYTRVGRLDEADTLLDELHKREAQKDEYANHFITVARGMVAFCRGELDAAESMLETAVKAFGRQGSSIGQMESMMYLAWVTLDLGKERRTRVLAESSLALSRTYAGVLYEATNLWILARLALVRDELDDARMNLASATDVARRRREAVGSTFALFVWADLACAERQWARSATLFGSAEQALEELPHIMPPSIGSRYATARQTLRRELGDAGYEQCSAAGRSMPLWEAAAFALDQRAGMTSTS